jgi:hypothetical protein
MTWNRGTPVPCWLWYIAISDHSKIERKSLANRKHPSARGSRQVGFFEAAGGPP